MRNWMIPQAAYFLHGHVSLTLIISRTGAITELQVIQPSSVEGFTHAAYNALAASNPTVPLPHRLSGPDAAHACDLLLQRGAAGSDAMIVPTRAQQRGLLLLLAALTMYVCWILAR